MASQSPQQPRLLVGDIGGTQARLQLWRSDATLVWQRTYASAAYASLETLLADALADARTTHVDACVLAMCGPVADEERMCGPPLEHQPPTRWGADARRLSRHFGPDLLGATRLLNDLVAVGLGLSALGPADRIVLHDAPRQARAPIACLAAGTGLGAVFLTWQPGDPDGRYQVWPSEAGMCELRASTERELRLRHFLAAAGAAGPGHATIESAVSGPGLLCLYRFACAEAGRPALLDSPAAVSAAAEGGDALCAEAVDLLLDVLAAELRAAALRWLPHGGLYVAGGVVAALRARIAARLPSLYLADPCMRDVLAAIPLYLVTRDDVGLLGARERALRLLHEPPSAA